MNNDSATPTVDGHSLKLVRIEGPRGPFEVAYAGLRQDANHGFYYRDARGQFGFYADIGRHSSDPVNITYATTHAWGGGPFETTRENEALFRQNIELFLTTRNWMTPERLGDAAIAATRVTFSWSIV